MTTESIRSPTSTPNALSTLLDEKKIKLPVPKTSVLKGLLMTAFQQKKVPLEIFFLVSKQYRI